jgi:membrane protease YdiL (CAAX protease family)
MNENILPPLEPQLVMPPVLQPPPKKFWGAWATIGYGAIIMVATFIAQGIAAVVFVIAEFLSNQELDIEEMANRLLTNGDLFSTATIGSFIIGMILILIFIKVRQGAGFKEYLAINSLSKKAGIAVVAVVIAFIAFSYGISIILPEPEEPDIMLEAYKSISWAPLLWIAAVICAPVFEEAFFRGFLFTGLQHSKVGTVGTIFLTALPWALMHIQYDIPQIALIFFLGIILGIARSTTRSIWSPLIIHSFNNLMAMVEISLRASGTLG